MRLSLRRSLNRRQFLSTAGCAAAAVAAAPGLVGSAAEAGRWKMKLSCSTINYTKLSVEEACKRIAALGFEGVDVWSGHAGCPHLDDVLNRLGAEGLKQILDETKLKLYSFSVYSGGYRRYAELLGKAGGGVAVRGSGGGCPPAELTNRMKAFMEAVKPELELAEKYDSYLAIENHGGSLLSSLDSFKAFVDNNTNPRLGIALAPYHLQTRKASIEEAITTAGKQLLFFYAWQHSPGNNQLPGIGPTDCEPWIAALAKADYAWYVNPFLHHEPAPDEMDQVMAKSVAYLKECYAKAVGG